MRIPEGWRTVELAEVCPKTHPIVYGIVQAGPHVEDGIRYIRSTDVGGDIVPSKLLRTSPAIATKYKRAAVRSGDVVFSLPAVGHRSAEDGCRVREAK